MFEAQGKDGNVPKWIGVIQRVTQSSKKEMGSVRNASSNTHTWLLSVGEKWKVIPEFTDDFLFREGSGAAKRGWSREPAQQSRIAGQLSWNYCSFQCLFPVLERGKALETWKKRSCLSILLDNKAGTWPFLACSKMVTSLQSFVLSRFSFKK